MGIDSRRKIKQDTLADKFKNARKKAKLDLAKVQSATRIPKKYLLALEDGDYGKLPEPVYTRGFITRYSELLNLKIADCLRIFEKELSEFSPVTKKRLNRNQSILTPHSADLEIMNSSRLVVTPEVIWGGIIGAFILGIFGYIWFAVASFAAAPQLEITSSTPLEAIRMEKITISGFTDPQADLEINSQFVTVGNDGYFSAEINLVDGINNIQISARNQINKTTQKSLQVLAEIEHDIQIPVLENKELEEDKESPTDDESSDDEAPRLP